MIYGQQGIESFIVDALPRPGLLQTRAYTVATEVNTDRILGFADFDIRNEFSPHLAYICVAAEAQGRGIATSLIQHFLKAHPLVRSLTLDVFEQNAAARSLYRKLGFLDGYRTAWHERSLPAQSLDGEIGISNFPNLIASHQRFGFSMATVENSRDTFRIGRLGDGIFRISDPDIFADDRFLSRLRRIFPETHSALLISRSESFDTIPAPTRQILVSVNMQLTLASEIGIDQP